VRCGAVEGFAHNPEVPCPKLALLTAKGRLKLARVVVEEGWTLARAAERFQCSKTTVKRGTDRYRAAVAAHGAAGVADMADRSSRPRRSPTVTRRPLVRKIRHLRMKRKLGPAAVVVYVRQSVDGGGARLCPCGLVTATPWSFVTSQARPVTPSREFPAPITGTRAHRLPAHIHRVGAGSDLKRRYGTGSSRAPSRLAHRARPIRQYWTGPASSRLLPPSPASPGSGCRQLHPTATTARRRRPLTSIRNTSASCAPQTI
jgi:hypothetical protein